MVGSFVARLVTSVLPPYLGSQDYSAANVGIVIGGDSLATFILMLIAGRLVHRFGQLRMAVIGGMFLVSAMFLLPFSSQVAALLAALLLLRLGTGSCFVAGASLLLNSLRVNERGRVLGIGGIIIAIFSSTSALASFTYERGGIVIISIAGGILSLTFITISMLIIQRHKFSGTVNG
jgi:CP family cyanate transporter-like MFS transporter